MANTVLTIALIYIAIGLLFSRLYLYKEQATKKRGFIVLIITLLWLPIAIIAMVSVYKGKKTESDE